MNAPTSSGSLANLSVPWLRTQNLAAGAFVMGFLAGFASTGTTLANLDSSPETLAALVFGLAGGLLGAAATYISALLCRGIRSQLAHPPASGTDPDEVPAKTEADDLGGWCCFGTLFLAVVLTALLKHGFVH